MKVGRIDEADRDLAKLAKRYRDIPKSVEQFERLLSQDKVTGHQYAGLRLQRDGAPAAIWKSRVIVPSLGGSSSGLRYVYERLLYAYAEEDYAICLTAYVHQSGIDENKVIAIIRERFGRYEDTAALCLLIQL